MHKDPKGKEQRQRRALHQKPKERPRKLANASYGTSHPYGSSKHQRRLPLEEISKPTASQEFMDHFKERFLAKVEVDSILWKLLSEGVIDHALHNRIESTHDCEKKRYMIWQNLRDQGIEATLLKLCDVLESGDIKTQMSLLGKDMKAFLERHVLVPQCQSDKDVPQQTDVNEIDDNINMFKINQIVKLYRAGELGLRLPFSYELQENFSDLVSKVCELITALDDKSFNSLEAQQNPMKSAVLRSLQSQLCTDYYAYVQGVGPFMPIGLAPQANAICEFIRAKSNIFETVVIETAYRVLSHPKRIQDVSDSDQYCCLMKDFETSLVQYRSLFTKFLARKLSEWKSTPFIIPFSDVSTVAVVLSNNPDKMLASLVIEIKDYLKSNLKLSDFHFKGIASGCSILLFLTSSLEALLLAPKVLSHSAQLCQQFPTMTHVIAFENFVCNVKASKLYPIGDVMGGRYSEKPKEDPIVVIETLCEELSRTKLELEQCRSELLEHTSSVDTRRRIVSSHLGAEGTSQLPAQQTLHQLSDSLVQPPSQTNLGHTDQPRQGILARCFSWVATIQNRRNPQPDRSNDQLSGDTLNLPCDSRDSLSSQLPYSIQESLPALHHSSEDWSPSQSHLVLETPNQDQVTSSFYPDLSDSDSGEPYHLEDLRDVVLSGSESPSLPTSHTVSEPFFSRTRPTPEGGSSEADD